jgi:beta-mannosidase
LHGQHRVAAQLNDCWPVTSWAAIDGNGRAKPLWYSMKHSYSDRLVTIQPDSDGLAVVIINDSGEGWEGELIIERRDFDGTVLAAQSIAYQAGARVTTTIPIPAPLSAAGDAARELVVARVGDERGLWFFSEYRDSQLGDARLTATATKTPTGYSVTVVAESLVRDLALLVDKLDAAAVVNDMLVTLLPGESVEFSVRSTESFDPELLLAASVLRCANQLLLPADRTAVVV